MRLRTLPAEKQHIALGGDSRLLIDQYDTHSGISIHLVTARRGLVGRNGNIDPTRQQRPQHGHDLASPFRHSDRNGVTRHDPACLQRLRAAQRLVDQRCIAPLCLGLYQRCCGRALPCFGDNPIVQKPRGHRAGCGIDPSANGVLCRGHKIGRRLLPAGRAAAQIIDEVGIGLEERLYQARWKKRVIAIPLQDNIALVLKG